MDPNETLRRLRAAIASANLISDDYHNADDDETVMIEDVISTLDDVAGMAEALDEWLTKGGFPPADWDHRPTA